VQAIDREIAATVPKGVRWTPRSPYGAIACATRMVRWARDWRSRHRT